MKSPRPQRWLTGIRAAVSTAVPVILGVAFGDLGAGLIATIGAFTVRFGTGRPYLNRGLQLAVVAVSLAAAVALGDWSAQQTPWAGVVAVSLVATAAVWLCHALTVGPPGAYVFVVACAAGVGASGSHISPWRMGLLVLGGGAIAWLVQMAGALTAFRGPERAAVSEAGEAVAGYVEAAGSAGERRARHRAAAALHRSWRVLVDYQPVDPSPDSVLHRLRAANHALHIMFVTTQTGIGRGVTPPADAADQARRLAGLAIDPETIATRPADRTPLRSAPIATRLSLAVRTGSHTRNVMVRVGIGALVAGTVSRLLGVDHAYWAMAAAVLVLHQGADRSRTLRRGSEYLLGTWLGLGLAAAILLLHPDGLWLALVLAVLQFAIVLLVTERYLFATVFITAMALTISSGAHRVDPGALLLARGSDVLLGCAVGVAVYLAAVRRQETTRLTAAAADTLDALAATIPHLADRDFGALAARSARRNLQSAAIALMDAEEAASAGSAVHRAIAEWNSPTVAAVERLAYRVVAVCWEIEHRASRTPDTDLVPTDVPLASGDVASLVGQLRALATSIRQGSASPPAGEAPGFIAADIEALRAALGTER